MIHFFGYAKMLAQSESDGFCCSQHRNMFTGLSAFHSFHMGVDDYAFIIRTNCFCV